MSALILLSFFSLSRREREQQLGSNRRHDEEHGQGRAGIDAVLGQRGARQGVSRCGVVIWATVATSTAVEKPWRVGLLRAAATGMDDLRRRWTCGETGSGQNRQQRAWALNGAAVQGNSGDAEGRCDINRRGWGSRNEQNTGNIVRQR
ncbi:hypothetical protein M0R45_007508 [Rubus argutus]|uniref:Uncharacterized protein n=1 Tax=Rubus argutus TaxID=59490 RepID=A0AAW1XYR5_RUBAR